MLNMTKVEPELTSDADMYLFFEKGRGGRVSCISNRYSKANNKYLKYFDPNQESKHIYLDRNNSSAFNFISQEHGFTNTIPYFS